MSCGQDGGGQSLMRTVFVLLALSFHSCVEGLALALEVEATTQYLTVSLTQYLNILLSHCLTVSLTQYLTDLLSHCLNIELSHCPTVTVWRSLPCLLR